MTGNVLEGFKQGRQRTTSGEAVGNQLGHLMYAAVLALLKNTFVYCIQDNRDGKMYEKYHYSYI